jgi:hypothetical protein
MIVQKDCRPKRLRKRLASYAGQIRRPKSAPFLWLAETDRLFSGNEDEDLVVCRRRFITVISKDVYVAKARALQH